MDKDNFGKYMNEPVEEVKEVKEIPVVKSKVGTVVDNCTMLNVREKPNLDAAVICSVNAGSKLDITEEVYYEIIRMKTATLIAACCEIGVLSNNADENLAKKMKTNE